MDHFNIIMSLIAGMYLSIIGLYIWTFKQIGSIHSKMNVHLQDLHIHTEDINFVRQDVCNALHKALVDKVEIIHDDVKTLVNKAG